MTHWPSLLFVAPILPAESGNGLAMRAGVFLDAFSHDFEVTLLVVPLAGYTGEITRFVAERTHRVVTLSLDGKLDPLWELSSRILDPETRTTALASYPRPALCRYATSPCLKAAQAALAGNHFEFVHVMRSYLVPYAAPFLPDRTDSRSPFASLDLDDDEALTHLRIAALLERMGLPLDARLEAHEAAKYERHEAQWLPHFHLLITCTPEHSGKVSNAHPHSLAAIVPNTVRLPRLESRLPHSGKHILFVGNLSYLPNVDGICRFAQEILPEIQARLGGNAVLQIAGSAPSSEVTALSRRHGIELVADPADLSTHYQWADIAVVPLAAGGGTRIKLLEAFAHGVPVVASTIGAEGIAAKDRIHLLLADTPRMLIDACVELLVDASLAKEISERARQLVEKCYGHSDGVMLIREAFGNKEGNRCKP
jgi:glycosyltransferase involved in cell wall biosynthesis